MFLTLSKQLWKFQGACGPEQLRVVNCNAVPKGATAHLGSDETVKYAVFQQLIPDVLHAILKCPKNGGCTELTKKDSWSSDGHLTNITNKQARKYRNFTFSDRYGFKICEKLTLPTRAKNITCETVWYSWKAHILYTLLTPSRRYTHGKFCCILGCTIHPVDKHWRRKCRTWPFNFSKWIWFFKFTLSCSFNFLKPRWVVRSIF